MFEREEKEKKEERGDKQLTSTSTTSVTMFSLVPYMQRVVVYLRIAADACVHALFNLCCSQVLHYASGRRRGI